MKTRIILKSLAELPGNTLHQMTAAPLRAVAVSRRVLSTPAKATRRQIREARRRSLAFMRGIYARARAPLRSTIPWVHGGLNE